MKNISIMSQDGKQAYGVKEYVVDTSDDVENLPHNVAPGSVAIVASNSEVYILNNQKEWVKL